MNTNEQKKFVLNLLQRLDLKRSNKYIVLQNLLIHYTWKNRRQQYKNNKIKIISPTWMNNESELLDGSYSVPYIHNYIEYIKTKHETSSINLPIHIYINRISNRLVFKKKKEDAYKLELETTETMKLLGSTKKSTNKTKNGENLPSLSTISITKVRGIIYFYAQ